MVIAELVKRLRALTLQLLPVEADPDSISEPTSRIITPEVISAYMAAAGDFVEAVSCFRVCGIAIGFNIISSLTVFLGQEQSLCGMPTIILLTTTRTMVEVRISTLPEYLNASSQRLNTPYNRHCLRGLS
jgi:hypothetical protein